MRVAEHAALEQPHVLAQLRLGVESAAGVVEVHVAVAVKARELAAAQLIEYGCFRVTGMAAAKRRLQRLGLRGGEAHPAGEGRGRLGVRAIAAATKIRWMPGTRGPRRGGSVAR